MPRPTPNDWLMLALLAFCFGSAFMAIEVALDALSPLWVAAGRIALGAVVLTCAAILTGAGLPDFSASGRREWLFAGALGLAQNALPFALISWGQTHATSSFAGIAMSMVPLFILPLAHIFVPGERITWPKMLGFSIGFVGTLVLIDPRGILANPEDPMVFWGRLAIMSAAAGYAVGAIITRRAPPMPLLRLSASGLVAGALFILPVALWRDGLPALPTGAPALAMLWLGLIPTAAAAFLLVTLIRRVGPSFIGFVNYIVPVWAVLLGVGLLGEAIPSTFASALALILVGVGVAEFGKRRR